MRAVVYDLKRLSEMLGISIRSLRAYIKRGELKARKIGRAYYVSERNLLAFCGGPRAASFIQISFRLRAFFSPYHPYHR